MIFPADVIDFPSDLIIPSETISSVPGLQFGFFFEIIASSKYVKNMCCLSIESHSINLLCVLREYLHNVNVLNSCNVF